MKFIYLSYGLLAGAVISAFWRESATWILLGLATGAGLFAGNLGITAMPFALALAGLGWAAGRAPFPPLRLAVGLVFALAALPFLLHWVPGFRNLLVYDRIRFAEDSLPFTLYLNFDKTLVGLFIAIFYLGTSGRGWLRRRDLVEASAHAGLLLALMAVLAPLSGYVRWDPKWPPLAGLWALNNLLFVCLAEEGFFRGFLEEGLLRAWPKRRWVAILVPALLFGASHYAGGWAYVAFASLAGIFYGSAYARTRRIEVSMLVHFALNLVHFGLFSYPALDWGR